MARCSTRAGTRTGRTRSGPRRPSGGRRTPPAVPREQAPRMNAAAPALSASAAGVDHASSNPGGSGGTAPWLDALRRARRVEGAPR
jgi:hypothetical protein